jgi:hypothetical protein
VSADASAPRVAAEAPAAEAPAPPPPAPATAEAAPPHAPAARRALAPETQADKDLAKDAWHKNQPDISVTANRASLLIPIKGSADGGDYKLVRKSRTVTITLPNAASLNTLRYYRLKRQGFLALWVDQAEKNARPSDGTKLRVILAGGIDPEVELRDDFVRVSLARAAGAAEPSSEPAPSSSSSEDAAGGGDKE